METELHQQKFLTLECEGHSRISSTTPTGRRRGAPSYHFLHLLTLRPASEGRLLRAPTAAGLLFMLSAGSKRAWGSLVLGN